MTTLTTEDLLRWRLHSLRLSGPLAADPASVVDHLLAVQAENHAQASWALGSRCGADLETVDDAHEYDVLRTHVLRTTWHYVRPADIGWLLELCRPRLTPLWERRLDAAGVDRDGRARAVAVVERALAEAGPGGRPLHLTRPEIAAALSTAGLPLVGMPLGHLLGYAETVGVICSGVRREEHTYALLAERAPERRRLTREESLAELARRYVVGHGPVTDRDLAYWATLTLRDARAGLADAGLDTVEVEGTTYWCHGEPVLDEPEPRGHLLQILDEAYRGFQDSRGLLDRAGLMVPGRERAIGMVLVAGQIVGSMTRTVGAREVRFDLTPWRRWTEAEIDVVDDAAGRYGAFLGRAHVVRLVEG